MLRLACAVLLLGTAVPVAGWAAETSRRPPDTMAARMAACTPCHGDKGQGTGDPYFPRIAGKPAGYLANQLIAFREGRRKYAPMNYLLEFQNTDYLEEIAAYFAALRPPAMPPAPPTVSEAVLRRGRMLVEKGDPAHSVPPCSGCHGPALTGMEPAIPGLVGLQARYISAQLGAFRYGTRTAAQPDCMQIVAGHLTEAAVTAVAAYLASLPVPADPAPLPQGSLTMPLACGSQPK